MQTHQFRQEDIAIGVFTVVTSHGTILQADVQTGRLFHALSKQSDARCIILFIPRALPVTAFLMTVENDIVHLNLIGDATSAQIIPLRLQKNRGNPAVALCHPFTGRYLCAVPPLSSEQRGTIVIDREDCNDWETFILCPFSAGEAPSFVTATNAIELWAALPFTGPQLLDTIEQGLDPATSYAFDAFAKLLPRDQIEWMGPTVLGRSMALTNLANAFPQDVFAVEALPSLSTWLATRPEGGQLHLPCEADELADLGLNGSYTSFSHMCSAHARRFIPARKTVCLLATARNEGPYLVEWIAYHRSISIQEIYIYSNNNDDGSDALLSALAQAGIITWVRSDVLPGHAAQPKAYGHALGVLPHILDNRWTLIIDLDEFFAFDQTRFASIKEYIMWQEARPVNAIALNWLVYGSSGEVFWQDAPLTSRFVKRLPWIDKHIKSMVLTNQAMHSRPHYPTIDARQVIITRNASGALHVTDESPSFSASPEADTAWINHYFLKSAEEFIWKFSRNRGDHALVRDSSPSMIDRTFADMFVSQHTSPAVVLDDRILACGQGQAEQTAYLLSLPGVLEAHRAIIHQYHQGISRLREMIRVDPAFQTEDTPYRRLRDLLAW